MEGAVRTPRIHRLLDHVTGILLLAMTVFAPWAFGTTETLAIWIMNGAGYALGGLLAAKWLVRRRAGYRPSRWDDGVGRRWPVRLTAVLTVLVLAYVIVGALNARAVIDYVMPASGGAATGIDVRYLDDPVPWLPHSYDGPRTLRAFWKYLAMAMGFWAARDWLLTKSRQERRQDPDSEPRFPTDRVQRLLWTFALSAAALSLTGILQRLDGTWKLLWLFKSPNPGWVNFGPFPYRGNGAQYLNLLWPTTLGFWSALRERNHRRRGAGARAGGDPHVVLLPLSGIMLAGTFLTGSRGGVLLLAGLVPAALAILFTASRTTRLAKALLVGVFVAMLAGGWYLGGAQLAKRFATVQEDGLSGREEIYRVAGKMESDFTLFGSGAETFPRLYYLYRDKESQHWHAYAHDDYLEMRITFGLIGSSLVAALLLCAVLSGPISGGIPATREFLLLLLTGMSGMMIHARVDLPFQLYSLHFEFLVLCELLSCLRPVRTTREVAPGSGDR